MSLLELLPSHVTSCALAQACPSWSSYPVMSLLELLPSHVTPGALAQSCHSLSPCPVMSLLELLPSNVTPGAFAQSCHFLNSCPSHVTPGDLPGEFVSPSGVLLSDFACRGKKKKFFGAMRKKILSNNTYCTLLRM